MVSSENVAQLWAQGGLCRFHSTALDALDLPADAIYALRDLGLPRQMEPFFWTDADEADIPTLGTYVGQDSARLAQYYRIGTDEGTQICIARGT